ncbi:hypothetical protein K3495_g3573 [Podosphaera aphanis]|nr:hypothetical protein K3495_g3573 [Podosphaera aphanis]
MNLQDVLEKRPLYEFALALKTIDQIYAAKLELRISKNVKQRSPEQSVNLIQLESIVEEFQNYWNRHQAFRQNTTLASFATSHNGKKLG